VLQASLIMITEHQKNIIIQNLTSLSPDFIGIFGSYARSEENTESDIDILIDPAEQTNLLDIIGAEQSLTEILNRKIDLITLRSLNPNIKPSILNDLVRIV
jgi:predicted nucleotidyltransferase